MTSKSELQRAAMADVRSGRPRPEVFAAFRERISPERHLAFSIASVADPARARQGARLNSLLFGLLIAAVVSKAVLALPYFGVSFLRGMFMLAIGLLVPVAFAIAVRRYDGQVYPFLTLLAGIGALTALMKMADHGAWMLLDAALLVVIAVIAFQVQRIVFPNIRGFAVRKDAQGNYLW